MLTVVQERDLQCGLKAARISHMLTGRPSISPSWTTVLTLLHIWGYLWLYVLNLCLPGKRILLKTHVDP